MYARICLFIPTSLDYLFQSQKLRIIINKTKNSDFSINALTQIPTEIGNLISLTHLNKRNIKRTKHMINIDLDNNKLSVIPKELCRLTSLVLLHIFKNQFQTKRKIERKKFRTVGKLFHFIAKRIHFIDCSDSNNRKWVLSNQHSQQFP